MVVWKPQKAETKEKFLYNFISVRDGTEKIQKQGRGERTQGDYPTSTVYFFTDIG